MKISLDNLKNGLFESVRRFPFQVFVSIIATVAGWRMVKYNIDDTFVNIRVLLICNLTFVLSLAIDLFLERRKTTNRPESYSLYSMHLSESCCISRWILRNTKLTFSVLQRCLLLFI